MIFKPVPGPTVAFSMANCNHRFLPCWNRHSLSLIPHSYDDCHDQQQLSFQRIGPCPVPALLSKALLKTWALSVVPLVSTGLLLEVKICHTTWSGTVWRMRLRLLLGKGMIQECWAWFIPHLKNCQRCYPSHEQKPVIIGSFGVKNLLKHDTSWVSQSCRHGKRSLVAAFGE